MLSEPMSDFKQTSLPLMLFLENIERRKEVYFLKDPSSQ